MTTVGDSRSSTATYAITCAACTVHADFCSTDNSNTDTWAVRTSSSDTGAWSSTTSGTVATVVGRAPLNYQSSYNAVTMADVGPLLDAAAANLSGLSDVVFKIDQNEYGVLLDDNGTMAAAGGLADAYQQLLQLNGTAVAAGNGTGVLDPNRTYYIFESVYPSAYSVPEIVVASVVVIMLMIVVVVGNMLVIIAIVTEKALKNVQNWFIASLAVADFFLGIIVMPFSLANELMGYWIFGDWWCDIHAALDVLLCTASIMNLCLIALDRYWSITQAVAYLKKRTPARAMVMIAFVWIFSGVICIPPLLGWKVKRVPERYPKCEVSGRFALRLDYPHPPLLATFCYSNTPFCGSS